MTIGLRDEWRKTAGAAACKSHEGDDFNPCDGGFGTGCYEVGSAVLEAVLPLIEQDLGIGREEERRALLQQVIDSEEYKRRESDARVREVEASRERLREAVRSINQHSSTYSLDDWKKMKVALANLQDGDLS